MNSHILLKNLFFINALILPGIPVNAQKTLNPGKTSIVIESFE